MTQEEYAVARKEIAEDYVRPYGISYSEYLNRIDKLNSEYILSSSSQISTMTPSPKSPNTQAQIAALKDLYDDVSLPIGTSNEDTYKQLKVCYHVWKTYDSGWNKYDYCEKCDVRRDTSNDAPKTPSIYDWKTS